MSRAMGGVRRFYHAEDDIATMVEAVLGQGGEGRVAFACVGLGCDPDYAEHGRDSGFYVEVTLSGGGRQA